MNGRVAAALFAAAALAGCAGAPNPSPSASARDPQSAFEPRSEPGAGQRLLARMAGDWDVVKTIHRRSGEPAVSRGTCRQTMIHGGRFLQSEFAFDGDSGRTTGTGIIGFDAATGAFTSIWIDSRATKVSVRQSTGAFDGERIELWSKSLGDERNARRSRTVTELADGDRRLVHRQFNITAEGERLLMQLELTRRGAP